MAISDVWPSLDPFTDVVSVHWGSLDTKLDFVNNRYMVANVDQAFSDVIRFRQNGVVDESTLVTRTDGTGLDLRYVNPGNNDDLRAIAAFLKNKDDAKITKTNPGALNEFSKLNYTIVVEMDWHSKAEGTSPNGFDGTGEVKQRDIVLANQMIASDGTTSTLGGFGTNVFEVDQGAFDFVEGVSYSSKFVGYTIGRLPPDPYAAMIPPSDGVTSDGVTYWSQTTYNAMAWQVKSFGLWLGVTDPSVPTDPTVDVFMLTEPSLGAFTSAADDDVSNLRSIPARIVDGNDPFNDPTGVFDPGVQTGGYGISRFAVTVTGSTMSISVNGGPVLSAGNYPSDFTIPRTSGPFIATNTQFYFQPYAVLRCVWLFAKPKAAKLLPTLSTVRALVPATASNWPSAI